MSDNPAHKILADLFQTIIDEAKRNPSFADEMLNALPDHLKSSIEPKDQKTKSVAPKQAEKSSSFDLKSHNPLVMYRDLGEDLMRVNLKKLTNSNLKAVTTHYKLKLKPHLNTKSPNKAELVTAIVAFAKHYDVQRKGAAD